MLTNSFKEVQRVVTTINNAKGVYAFTLFNEYNNPREFPKNFVLTPEMVTITYNKIRAATKALMGPGAVDPFNALAGDPRDWVRSIYNSITGADLIAMHGYTRGPDPENVGSNDKFTDDPLTYQYLNYHGCIETMLGAIPYIYKELPIYITEFNHLYKYDGKFGWENDQNAADTVWKAHLLAQYSGYAGLAVYRWSGDDWAIENNQSVLGAIEDLIIHSL